MKEAGLTEIEKVGGSKELHAMGHSQIEITLNVYGHLLKDREENEETIAEELFG
jgi:hypothetical protein